MLSAKVILPSTETLGSGECFKMNWMWSLLTFSPHLYMSQLISLKDEIIISNITLVAEAAAPRPPTDTSVGHSEIKPNPKESHQSWCYSANTKRKCGSQYHVYTKKCLVELHLLWMILHRVVVWRFRLLNSSTQEERPSDSSFCARPSVHLPFEEIRRISVGKLQRKREAGLEGSNH